MTNTTKLGTNGPEVFPLALGCMGMGARSMYGDNDEDEGIATIHAALERGVNLIDTGDFYSMGRNEMLVGKALKGQKRERALLSVKFGATRSPDGGFSGYDTRPVAVKNFLTYSLARLGVDYIDIYRPARLDGQVPIEDTMGAIADMVKAGYVRYIGLSEVGVDTIKRAVAVHPIVDLQIEYSLLSRGPEEKIFPALREMGIATTAYGVLSRGLLSGSKPSASNDFRAYLPRFVGENGEKNRKLVEAFATVAVARGVTPSQLAIAWVMAKSTAAGAPIVPTIGARTRAQLADALDARSIILTPSEVASIEEAVPATAVAGTRYAAPLMAHLDSER
jgi:aryl-alcohol dehydrogenase-like predicted oxidoreductase